MKLSLNFSANPAHQEINHHYRQALDVFDLYFMEFRRFRTFDGFLSDLGSANAYCQDIVRFYNRCWLNWHKIERKFAYWPSSFGSCPATPGELLQKKLSMDYEFSLQHESPIKESALERWCYRATRKRKQKGWKRYR